MTKSQVQAKPLHRVIRINHLIRTVAFAWSFLVAAIHGWERDLGLSFWILAGLCFLAYPHLANLRSRLSPEPKTAELTNLYVDSFMLGAWIAGLGAPLWLAYAALHATSLNAIVLRGLRGVATSVAAFAGGAAFWLLAGDFSYQPATRPLVTALCFIGSVFYTCAIGYVEFLQNRRLVAAREALRESESRYRLITENAADLVAMVDPEGRWLYASPSYDRILGQGAVALGADAFARAIPDDAEKARYEVRRVSITGKSREFVLRVADGEGRVRQLKTRIQ